VSVFDPFRPREVIDQTSITHYCARALTFLLTRCALVRRVSEFEKAIGQAVWAFSGVHGLLEARRLSAPAFGAGLTVLV
jgi:hypothetical protein